MNSFIYDINGNNKHALILDYLWGEIQALN